MIKIFKNNKNLVSIIKNYFEKNNFEYSPKDKELILKYASLIEKENNDIKNSFFFLKQEEQAQILECTLENLHDFLNFEPIKLSFERLMAKEHETAYNNIVKKIALDKELTKFDIVNFQNIADTLQKNIDKTKYIFTTFDIGKKDQGEDNE